MVPNIWLKHFNFIVSTILNLFWRFSLWSLNSLGNMTCSQESGQCYCAENVEGRTCDHCSYGSYQVQ